MFHILRKYIVLPIGVTCIADHSNIVHVQCVGDEVVQVFQKVNVVFSILTEATTSEIFLSSLGLQMSI